MIPPLSPLAVCANCFARCILKPQSWRLRLIILCLTFGAILAPPNLTTLRHYQEKARPAFPAAQDPNLDRWDAITIKVQQPLAEMSRYFDPSRQEANRTFRFSMPLIAHYLGLSTAGALILGLLSGPTLFAGLIAFCQHQRFGRLLTGSVCLTASGLYFGQAWISELNGCFDGWAYAFMVLGLSTKRPLLIALWVTLAGFTDERALAASPLVLLSHLRKPGFVPSVRSLIAAGLSPQALAVFLSWCFILGSRAYMSVRLGLEPKNYTEATFLFSSHNLAYFGLFFFSAWKFLIYLLPVISITLWRRKVERCFIGLVLLFLTISCAVALMPLDQTRGLSHSTPYFLVLLTSLVQSGTSLSRITKWLFPIGLLGLALPNIATFDGIRCSRSILVELLNLWHWISA
jgi:hypothetical protein